MEFYSVHLSSKPTVSTRWISSGRQMFIALTDVNNSILTVGQNWLFTFDVYKRLDIPCYYAWEIMILRNCIAIFSLHDSFFSSSFIDYFAINHGQVFFYLYIFFIFVLPSLCVLIWKRVLYRAGFLMLEKSRKWLTKRVITVQEMLNSGGTPFHVHSKYQ